MVDYIDRSQRLFRVMWPFKVAGGRHIHMRDAVIVASPFELSLKAYRLAGHGKDGKAVFELCTIGDCVEPISEQEALRLLDGSYYDDTWEMSLSEFEPLPELESVDSVKELLEGSKGEE